MHPGGVRTAMALFFFYKVSFEKHPSVHGLPVLPWQVEVGVGIAGGVPGCTLRVPGAASMLDQGPS